MKHSRMIVAECRVVCRKMRKNMKNGTVEAKLAWVYIIHHTNSCVALDLLSSLDFDFPVKIRHP